uniref:Uncharacterized protein n=1 Tax=Cacopsylla melanoneura TaxID=428564 RepID=A0A8D8V8T4_9HEMI
MYGWMCVCVCVCIYNIFLIYASNKNSLPKMVRKGPKMMVFCPSGPTDRSILIRIKNDRSTDLEVQFWLDGGNTNCRYALHNGWYRIHSKSVLDGRLFEAAPANTTKKV